MEEKKLNNSDEISEILKTGLENIILKENLKNCEKNTIETIEELKTIYKKFHESEIQCLKLELELKDCNKSALSSPKDKKLQSEIVSLERELKLYKDFALQKDYIPISQFNDLYWGDNYPALKVLFDYLQKMNCLDINWSYFCNCMCIGNFTKINLKSDVLDKQDLGYLIAIIKKFFKDDYKGSPKKYLSFISRKFAVDSNTINKVFFDKYIREYKKGAIPTKLLKDKLDHLSIKISEAYR